MDIEILEEYEDLIMPGMQPGAEKGDGDNISDSSESVDMDIFDESSDEETNAATEKVVENVMQKRNQPRQDDSEDSLDQLVRELAHNREDESASNSLTSCLKKSSNCDKSYSAVQKHVAFAPLPTSHMSPANVSARQPIESFDAANAANSTRKSTIVKPEKIEFKDPAYDPLSLDQSDILNALSDISDQSFVSTTDIDIIETVLSSESSYGSVNSTTQSSTIASLISTAGLPEKPQVISHSILVPADTVLMDSLKNKSLELESNQIALLVSNNSQSHTSSTQQTNIKDSNEAESSSIETTNTAVQQVQAATSSLKVQEIETSNEIAETANIEMEPMIQVEQVDVTTKKAQESGHIELLTTSEIKESENVPEVAMEIELQSKQLKEESVGNPKVPIIQSENLKDESNNISKAKLEQKKDSTDTIKPEMMTENKTIDKIEADKSSSSGDKKTEKDKTSTTHKSKHVVDSKTIKPASTFTKKENVLDKEKNLESSSKKDQKVEKEMVKSHVTEKSRLPNEATIEQSKEKQLAPQQTSKEQTNTNKINPNSKPAGSITQQTHVKSSNIEAESVKSKNTTSKKSDISEKPIKDSKTDAPQQKDSNKSADKKFIDLKERNAKPKDERKSLETSGFKSLTSKEQKASSSSSEKSSSSKKPENVSGSKEKRSDSSKSSQQSRDLTPKRSNVTDSKRPHEKNNTPSGSTKEAQSPKKIEAASSTNSHKVQRSASSSSLVGSKQPHEKTSSSSSLKHEETGNKKDSARVPISNKLEKSASSSSLKKTHDALEKPVSTNTSRSGAGKETPKRKDVKEAENAKKLDRTASSVSLKSETDKEKETPKRKNTAEVANAKKLDRTASSVSLKSETDKEKETPKRKNTAEVANAKKLDRTASSVSLKSETDKEKGTPKRKNTAEVANAKKLERTSSTSSLKSERKPEGDGDTNTKKIPEIISSGSLKSESNVTLKRKHTGDVENTKTTEGTGSSGNLKSEGNKQADSASNTKKIQKSTSSGSLKKEENSAHSTKNDSIDVENPKKLEKSASSSSLKSERVVASKAKVTAETPAQSNTKPAQESTPKRKDIAQTSNTKSLEKSASSGSLKQENPKETSKIKEATRSAKPITDKKESNKQESSMESVKTQNQADAKTEDAQVSIESKSKSLESSNENKTSAELSNKNETEKADSNKQTTTKQTVDQTRNKEPVKSETAATTPKEESKEAISRKSMTDSQKDSASGQQEKTQKTSKITTTTTTTIDKTKTDTTKIVLKTVDKKAELSTEKTGAKEELPPSTADKSKEKPSRITIKRSRFDKRNEGNKPMQSPQATPNIKENNSKTDDKGIASTTVDRSKEKSKQENVVDAAVVVEGSKQPNDAVIKPAENVTQTPVKPKKESKTKAERKEVESTERLPSASSTTQIVAKVEATLSLENSSDEPKLVEPSNTEQTTHVHDIEISSSEVTTTPKATLLKRLQTDANQQDINTAIDEKRQLRKRGAEDSPDAAKIPTRSTVSRNVATASPLELKRNALSPAAAEVHTPTKKLKVETTRRSRRLDVEANSEEHSVSSTNTQESQANPKVSAPKTKAKIINEANKTGAKATTKEQKTATKALTVEAAQTSKQIPLISTADASDKTDKTETKPTISKESTSTSGAKEKVVMGNKNNKLPASNEATMEEKTATEITAAAISPVAGNSEIVEHKNAESKAAALESATTKTVDANVDPTSKATLPTNEANQTPKIPPTKLTTAATASKAAKASPEKPAAPRVQNVMTFNEWLARKNKSGANPPNDSEKEEEKTTESTQVKTAAEVPKNTNPNPNQSKPFGKPNCKKSEIEKLKEAFGKEINDALSSETASEDETIEAQIKLRSSPRKLESHVNSSLAEKDMQQQPVSTTTLAEQSKMSRAITRRTQVELLLALSQPHTSNTTISTPPQQLRAKNETPTQPEATPLVSKNNTPAAAVAETRPAEQLASSAEPSSNNEKMPDLALQSKPLEKTTEQAQTSVGKADESESQQKAAEVVDVMENAATPTSSEPAADEPVKPKTKRPRSEIELLRDSFPKEMRESGFEGFRRAHAESPRCLTKRSAALALATAPTVGRPRSKATRLNANATLNVSRPKTRTLHQRVSEVATKSLQIPEHTPTVHSSAKVDPKEAAKPDNMPPTSKTLTRNLKCRQLRVRLNRSVVRRYLRSQCEMPSMPTHSLRISARKRKATQLVLSDAKRFAASSTPTTTTPVAKTGSRLQRHPRTVQAKTVSVALPHNRRSKAGEAILSAPMQTNDDLLLTPISVAPVLATTLSVTSDSGRRSRKKRVGNTTVTSSLAANIVSTASAGPAVLNESVATPPALPSLSSSLPLMPTVQARTPVLQIMPLAEPVFTPKRELDDDEYNIQPTSSAAAALTAATSASYTPPVEFQSILSAGMPLVISGATSNSLPPGFIDNAGTRLYSYLHPTRYNNNHGNVMLDYCCPNLDGPMTAIDPTRRHDKIDAVVRELPAFISMETRLVTRAELEANSNCIPAAIRHKVQRMANAKSSPTTAFDQTVAQTTITRTILNPTVSAAPSTVPVNLSALQKQLPSTTTLTAKTKPTQRANAKVVAGAGGASSTTTIATTTTPTAVIKPTTLEEMRAKNSVSLRNFDLLIKKHYSRVAMLSYADRLRLQESMVNSTQLMSRDIDMASRVFQEYVTHMTLVTARAPSPKNTPTPAAIAAPNATPTNVITPTINTPKPESPTTRAQSKRATKSVAVQPKMVRKTVPIYNSNRSIIGYQVQMVPQTLTESANNMGAKTASLPSLASTTSSSINSNFNSPVASTSAMTSSGRRSGVFVINPQKKNNTTSSNPILANMLNSTPTTMTYPTTQIAGLHTSTPNTSTGAAGSVVTRSGRGVTLRQQLSRTAANTRAQATPAASTSLPLASTTPTLSTSLPCLPTLTRNPHLPPICEPSKQTVVTPRAIYAQANLPAPSTNKTQLIVVNHDISGNPLPTADESILPDECSHTDASIIKTEAIDY